MIHILLYKLFSSQKMVLIKSIFQPKGCQWLILGMQPIPLYLRFHVQNFFNFQTSVFPLKSLNFLLSPQAFSFHICFKIAQALSLKPVLVIICQTNPHVWLDFYHMTFTFVHQVRIYYIVIFYRYIIIIYVK